MIPWVRVALTTSLLCIHAAAQQPVDSSVIREGRPTRTWVPPHVAVGSHAAAPCSSDVVRNAYRSIQVNVDGRGCNISGDAANEPSIAVSLADPRKMVIGWRQFNSVSSDFREPGWAYSHDGGHTWVFRGSLDPGVFGSDPVLASGPDGEIYYLSINFEEMRLFHSFDGGLTRPLQTQVVAAFYDKPWMTVDTTHGIGRGNIYITSPSRVFRRSIDGGHTFTRYPEVNASGFTIAVAADGSLWVADAIPSGSTEIELKVSRNAKDAFVPPDFQTTTIPLGEYVVPVGNTGGGLRQPWIATDHSNGPTRGNVYALGTTGTDTNYPDPAVDPYDIVFVRSTDDGKAWSEPLRVNDDPYSPTSLQWFSMMAVAPNGRIDVAWNDTRNSGVPNVSELYYTYSTDGGETFAPNIAVSLSFDATIGFPYLSPKLGDYYHMVSDNLGVNVAYAATFNGEQDIYFLRIGPWDCNGNEIDDAADISQLRSRDCNANDVPDECESRVDVDGDGLTTLSYFATFGAALTGPGGTLTGDCKELLDPDHDRDGDLHDYYLLAHVFTSP